MPSTCRVPLLGLALVCGSLGAGAAPAADWNALQGSVNTERIYEEKPWLALLYYRPARGGWKSQADAADFFLAPDGTHDPRAEMLADLRAILAQDAEARCKFPARQRWLRLRLKLPEDTGVLDACPALSDWYRPLAASSASLHFASAYLESPSSMFGHTFIRLHTPGLPPLLTPTVNYAADADRKQSAIGFIARGLFGGFPGLAGVLPYYRRLRIYGADEGRDVWEYPLKLDPDQVEMLLLHLWEIKDGRFDYYFLDENCAYRTLALIAAARPDLGLVDALHGDVVPVETVKLMRDRGLLREPIYQPSVPRMLQWRVRDFSSEELDAVVALAHGARAPDDLAALAPAERARILAAAAQYLDLLIDRGRVDFQTREKVFPALTQARLQLDVKPPADPLPAPPSPDEAHAGHMLAAAWSRVDNRDGAEVAVAGFQHTLTDPIAGYEPGAEVVVLGARYRLAPAGSLEHFDLVRAESQTPSTRLLQQAAWSLSIGWVRKDIDGARPLVGGASYAIGGAVDAGVGVLSFTGGASLEGGPAFSRDVGLETSARVELTHQAGAFCARGFAEVGKYVAGEASLRREYGLRVGIPLGHDAGAELQYRRAGADEMHDRMTLELRKFF